MTRRAGLRQACASTVANRDIRAILLPLILARLPPFDFPGRPLPWIHASSR